MRTFIDLIHPCGRNEGKWVMVQPPKLPNEKPLKMATPFIEPSPPDRPTSSLYRPRVSKARQFYLLIGGSVPIASFFIFCFISEMLRSHARFGEFRADHALLAICVFGFMALISYLLLWILKGLDSSTVEELDESPFLKSKQISVATRIYEFLGSEENRSKVQIGLNGLADKQKLLSRLAAIGVKPWPILSLRYLVSKTLFECAVYSYLVDLIALRYIGKDGKYYAINAWGTAIDDKELLNYQVQVELGKTAPGVFSILKAAK